MTIGLLMPPRIAGPGRSENPVSTDKRAQRELLKVVSSFPALADLEVGQKWLARISFGQGATRAHRMGRPVPDLTSEAKSTAR